LSSAAALELVAVEPAQHRARHPHSGAQTKIALAGDGLANKNAGNETAPPAQWSMPEPQQLVNRSRAGSGSAQERLAQIGLDIPIVLLALRFSTRTPLGAQRLDGPARPRGRSG
jgi:hypothetical protein